MDKQLEPLPCTLDMLILNATALGPVHGHDGNRMTDAIDGTSAQLRRSYDALAPF